MVDPKKEELDARRTVEFADEEEKDSEQEAKDKVAAFLAGADVDMPPVPKASSKPVTKK